MRKRYEVHVVNTGAWHHAASVPHAMDIVRDRVEAGHTWEITRRIGAADPVVIHRSVRARAA